MRAFGLQPDQVLARNPATQVRAHGGPWCAMLYGALGLSLVSVLAYSIWAYNVIRSEGAMYAAIATIYIALSGVVLGRLVIAPGATGRFVALLAVAFLAYAVCWCLFWFGLKRKYHADLWGSVAGLAAMSALLFSAFGKKDGLLLIFLVLLGFHSLGYYVGGVLKGAVSGSTGKLLWGAAYGLGFGAGVGYLIYRCQEPLKLRLRSAVPA